MLRSRHTPIEPPSAVFRCDASPEIGSGHLMRCLILAEALGRRGWRTAFALNAEAFAASPRLIGLIDRLAVVAEDGGEAAQLASAFPSCDLLVVDHYWRDGRFEAECRGWAPVIVVLDDLADRRHDADVLVDDSFGRDARDYAGLVSPGTRLLCGAEYALLRPAFRRLRRGALEQRWRPSQPERLLLAMGGGAPARMTGPILAALRRARPDLEIDVVVGSSVDLAIACGDPALRVHTDTDAVATLTASADVAIGACGQMAWERCCLGLPSVAVVAADNQAQMARSAAATGVCEVAGWWSDVTAADLADRALALLADPDRRRAMSSAAMAACDGLGAERVTAVVEEICRRDRDARRVCDAA